MMPRHPRPTLWLMTDERQGDGLWAALARLPRGAGVVFRHHRTPAAARRALFERVRRVTRRRGLLLILAGPPGQAIGWKADGAHGRAGHRRAARPLVRTASAHNAREIAATRADFVFVSPVFPTRSHPGAAALGPLRFGLLARNARLPLVALGGMTRPRARRMARLGSHGWAAIDALGPVRT